MGVTRSKRGREGREIERQIEIERRERARGEIVRVCARERRERREERKKERKKEKEKEREREK
jgi:hypothetical protein